MLRAAVKAGTELGKKAHGFMNAGLLVPNELMVGLIEEAINSPECKNVHSRWISKKFGTCRMCKFPHSFFLKFTEKI